jgi:NAD(P)-dependent dehydrogenase (short-subunit alcohol dehydrogenase family)
MRVTRRDRPTYPRPPFPAQTQTLPGSFSVDTVAEFGANYPMQRPAQPVELVLAYVMLAEPMSRNVSGATIAVAGGKPMMWGTDP